LKDYYEKGKEIYETADTVINAISSGDIGSLISNLQSLLGGMNPRTGVVYTWGKGQGDRTGGYDDELGDMYQDQIAAYLASLPPEVRAQVESNLRGDYTRRIVYEGNEIDIADFTGSHVDQSGGVAGGSGTAGADSDSAVEASSEGVVGAIRESPDDDGPAELSPPRGGIPVPPEDGEEDLPLWKKAVRVYKNTRPAGLAKNAAMAASEPTVNATKKSAEYYGKKTGDAAYKTSKTAKKAVKATAKVAKKAAKKTAKVAKKTAKVTKKVAKKAAKATVKAAKKTAKWGAEKTKKSYNYWKDKTKKTVQTIGGKTSAWHFEDRDAKNKPLPPYKKVKMSKKWRLCLANESECHQNGKGELELKYIHKDGREVVYDGDPPNEIITDPRYKGTYNYVVMSAPPKNRSDVLGSVKYYPTVIAHLAVDWVPWKFGGNVRGKE
jgi:hypothetical protein